MTDIAKLSAEFDTAQLQAAVKQLEKLSVESAKAEVTVKKLEKAQTSASLAAARAAAITASNAAAIARGSATMSAAEKTAAAATMKQATASLNAARAADAQAASALKAAQAMLGESSAAKKLVDSLEDVDDVNTRTRRNMGRLAGQQQANMTNIAAQFQDIGVTAAMGMNPMMIGLQQGAQLTGVWGSVTGTTSQKMATFGKAIASAISPMSLLIVAITAGVAWLIQWGMEALNASDKTSGLTKTLEKAKLITYAFSEVQSILGGVIDLTSGKIKNQSDALYGLARAQLEVVRVTALRDQAAARTALSKGAVGTRSFSALRALTVGTLPDTAGEQMGQRRAPAEAIVQSFMGGTLGATAAIDALEKLRKQGRLTEDAFISLSVEVANFGVASENLKQYAEGRKALEGDTGALAPYLQLPKPSKPKKEKVEKDPWAELLKSADQQMTALEQAGERIGKYGQELDQLTYTQELFNQAKQAGIVITEADGIALNKNGIELRRRATLMAEQSQDNRVREFWQSMTENTEKMTASLIAQRGELGLTGAALYAYRYEQERLNEAKAAHITLSDSEQAAIRASAMAYGAQVEEIDKTRQAIDFAKGSTRDFLGSMKSGLMQGQSVWQSWGNAVMRVIDRVIDKLLDDLVSAMLKVNQTGGSGGILGAIAGIFGGISGATVARLAPSAADTIAANPNLFANGGAFTNGIVHKPTAFFAKGGTPGVMGEAGPEAILPLQRGPDGSLGVQMYGGASAQEPAVVQIVPSEYFDVVVNDRAAKVAAPMVVQGALAANKVSENTTARQQRRRLR